MATITTQFNEGTQELQSFVFVENPIVIEVQSAGFPEGANFKQIIVDVTTAMDDISRTHQFAVSIDSDSVVLDISSAVRSVMRKHEYTMDKIGSAKRVEYPYAFFSVTAKERYMDKDGIVVNTTPSSPVRGVAYFGGLSDYERWQSPLGYPQIGENGKLDVKFSTKPSGEIFANPDYTSKTSFTPGTPQAPGKVYTELMQAAGEGADNRERQIILFVNSRGVFETVSVHNLEAKQYDVSSEVMNMARTPSYAPKAGLTTHKTMGQATWKMSSGYVSREWTEWFTTEFLTAKHYWLVSKNGDCFPVVVTPAEETMVIYDRTDPSLRDVQFTVRAAIGGRVG